MPHLAAAATAAPSITTLAPIHDTREPVSTAAPNLWERIAIACRVKHYSLSTERTYVAWARKFVAWSGRRHPRTMGAAEVEAYLTHLAVDQGVSASTQNQALSALLFLYRAVLGVALHLADTKNGDRRSLPAHPRIATCLRYLPLATPRITLQAAYRRARTKVGMEDVRFHDLRHSAASEMVNAGVDLYTVGRVLGHRDPRSTQRYAHLTHDTLTDAVGKIGRKLPHKPPPKAKRKATARVA